MCISKLLKFFKKEEDITETEENSITVDDTNNDTNDEPIDEPIDEPVDDINLGQSANNIVILVDNGHGYNTKGKRSPYSGYGVKPEIDFFEYLWNRQIAKPIVEMLEGRPADDKLAHFMNAPSPSDVTFFGSTTLFSLLQPEKA